MKFNAAIAVVIAARASEALVASCLTHCAEPSCYCFPGDSCWPSNSIWEKLNSTTSGRLVATVPIGSPCHDPNYDAAACTALQSSWTLPQTHLNSSSSVMQPYFANQSCDPFTAESSSCLLGNYVRYAIDVETVNDIIAGVNFARENNVRFVIRNTGHDFLGRSTGAGALSVWTHNLKDIEFISDYSDDCYTGTAVKVGAGVLGYEILEASSAEGVVVVSGECPTVGLAGGYTQGGGHSALSTSFGLSADQTLAFEVVTANGTLITATRTENSDLYWALSGGGGGSWGVVVSMTVKTYPDAQIGGMTLEFLSATTTPDVFYSAISHFHSLLPAMIDNGTMVVYAFSNEVFFIKPVTAYRKSGAEVQIIMAPFIAILNDLGIEYAVSYTDSASYYDHYSTYMGPLPYGNLGVEEYQFASRLVPRSLVTSNNAALQTVFRNVTEHGVLLLGIAVDVSSQAKSSNAVLPAWRDSLIHATFTTPWNSSAPWADMVADQYSLTDDLMPQLTALTPNSGAYMNEADFRQPEFQETFFGVNYDELVRIKKVWDPESMFYATAGVGSEVWSVANDGRMCRTE